MVARQDVSSNVDPGQGLEEQAKQASGAPPGPGKQTDHSERRLLGTDGGGPSATRLGRARLIPMQSCTWTNDTYAHR